MIIMSRTIAPRFAVAAIAAGTLLSGCGGSSTSDAAPATTPGTSTEAPVSSGAKSRSKTSEAAGPVKPSGYKVVSDEEFGYQMALPPGYVQIKDKSDLRKIKNALGSEVSASGLSQQLVNESLKLIAVKPSTGDTINVVINASGGLTADQLPQMKSAIKENVEKVGATGVSFKSATLGGEQAIRTDSTFRFQGVKVPTVQYMTVSGDQVYTLTFSEHRNISANEVKQTVGSWRFLP